MEPFVVPNKGIDRDTRHDVGDIRVELRPVNIHSEDGLVMYLPNDRILLAGDTLEDTVRSSRNRRISSHSTGICSS